MCKCVEEGQYDMKSRSDASKELDVLRAKVCVTFCRDSLQTALFG